MQISKIKDGHERRWRVMAFCELHVHKIDITLSQQKYLMMFGSWASYGAADAACWDYRAVVKDRWHTWIEPEHMSEDEIQACVPLEVRDFFVSEGTSYHAVIGDECRRAAQTSASRTKDGAG